ncbi:hypothetical protein EDD18DRAFT_1439666 [Armillaria luteobubalina]|uniref:Uncharacterized protein n=1 Tax=Armillaria luteobubalina TaxID=153913 RepID=A0AA39UFM3_9AGAR|nr:hypothetical protein EDD18DRAFT_1439666 [Armillaria luteobubalina]
MDSFIDITACDSNEISALLFPPLSAPSPDIDPEQTMAIVVPVDSERMDSGNVAAYCVIALLLPIGRACLTYHFRLLNSPFQWTPNSAVFTSKCVIYSSFWSKFVVSHQVAEGMTVVSSGRCAADRFFRLDNIITDLELMGWEPEIRRDSNHKADGLAKAVSYISVHMRLAAMLPQSGLYPAMNQCCICIRFVRIIQNAQLGFCRVQLC